MQDNQILCLDDAAALVHSTLDTRLQYIRGGELPAARVGNRFVIVYTDLVAFVRLLAARQGQERRDATSPPLQNVPDRSHESPTSLPRFVQFADMPTKPHKNKGRHRTIPPLTPDLS
jgi:hypothetical protein